MSEWWLLGSAPTFLENLAIDPAGAIFVSLFSHNRLERYDPATGAAAPFADLPAPPMGLTFDAGGSLWVTGGTFGKGPGYIRWFGSALHSAN
jgi:sugar lactone lactonase YvrE